MRMQTIFDEWRFAAGSYTKLLHACHRLSHGETCECMASRPGVDTKLFATAVRPVTSAIKNRSQPTKKNKELLQSDATLQFDFFTMQPIKNATEPISSEKRERAESAPEASVVRVKLSGLRTHSSSHVRLPDHLRSAQGPASFDYTFDCDPGALVEALGQA